MTGTGELPVAFTATARSTWLTVSPGAGSLDGGTSRIVTVRADRSRVPEGRSTGSVVLRWATGSTTVKVSLTQDLPPRVGAPVASAAPSCGTPTVTVRASVADASGLSSVRLRWSGPHGPGSATMTRSGSQWTAPMGPFTLGGTVTFRVVATDRAGHTTTGPARSVEATPCPG
ncbi:BACON domain-containing protein [Marmoricola sp. RAF53]|uniref:BACON domain-containing protein n=1 Tax=Marmoricola sp. RAF53 TaxID=3233059 RepID=UPI003F9EB460